jgi:YVTN family beta-propeller protein
MRSVVIRLRAACTLLPLLIPLGAACSGATVGSAAGIDSVSTDATRLPTGVHLDPAGSVHHVGPMPLNMVMAPGGRRAVLLLNGWARTGLQVVDWRSGQVVQTIDLPAAFLGLAFSPDGRSLYASGGNSDQVYHFTWSGDTAALADSVALAVHARREPGTRYPAQLAVSPNGEMLYVAENLADSLAVIDLRSRSIVQRLPAGRYPYGVVVAPDGTVYVSAWGGSSVAAYASAPAGLRAPRWINAGRHPSAMLLNRSGSRLYVASASTDRVSVVDPHSGELLAELRDPLPSGPDEGSTPNALALSDDELQLFVAEADANAVAVFNLTDGGQGRLAGRIPTGWYPAALLSHAGSVIVANGKGFGTHANVDGPGPRLALQHQGSGRNGTLGQLTGSLEVIDGQPLRGEALGALTARVAQANGWNAARTTARIPPFEHVIYVIRENRTYDQVLGDVSSADGDSSLVYFGRTVTPNAHALVERFGTFDRFFVNAEVSADGHNWTTAAYAGDYVEKTVQPNYSSRGRTYDYEGTNRGVVPDDDVNEPTNGYLWNLAASAGVSLRNYGEFVVPDRASGTPANRFVATKPALASSTNPQFPGFNLDITDQHRAEVWLAEFATYEERGTMPALEIVRLPNDHTSGLAAGKPSPRAAVADNDLALGRMVAALTRSQFWKSTVVFVLEDDAQNGPDHVDSHRSPLLVISPYSHAGTYHRFTNTTDVIATIEQVLRLGTLSHFDQFGRPLTDVWSAEADMRLYDPVMPGVPLSERNPAATRGARESRALVLDREDASDDDAFNRVLWRAVKGPRRAYPGPTRMALLEARRGR